MLLSIGARVGGGGEGHDGGLDIAHVFGVVCPGVEVPLS